MRVVSGKYEKGMKLRQVRTAKDVVISDALTFMAGDRSHVEEAYPAISSACTTTALFGSATPLPRVR